VSGVDLAAGADMFEAILNAACEELEKKSASLMLTYLAELDSRLSGIEKILSSVPGDFRV
jgi:hypothetical protein